MTPQTAWTRSTLLDVGSSMDCSQPWGCQPCFQAWGCLQPWDCQSSCWSGCAKRAKVRGSVRAGCPHHPTHTTQSPYASMPSTPHGTHPMPHACHLLPVRERSTSLLFDTVLCHPTLPHLRAHLERARLDCVLLQTCTCAAGGAMGRGVVLVVVQRIWWDGWLLVCVCVCVCVCDGGKGGWRRVCVMCV